jgi:serine/threonine protein kinase
LSSLQCRVLVSSWGDNEGLEAAQAKGVLHRDVKPSNCFVDNASNVKVGDFGLSISTLAREETQLTRPGTVLGTPLFASPEQLQGRELDVRSDIYSVGATLYYLLTGRAPFEGHDLIQLLSQILGEKPLDPAKLRPTIPSELSQIVATCLEKDRSSRFTDYDRLRRELRLLHSGCSDSIGIAAWCH